MWKIVNGDYEVPLIRRHIPFSEILKYKEKNVHLTVNILF